MDLDRSQLFGKSFSALKGEHFQRCIRVGTEDEEEVSLFEFTVDFSARPCLSRSRVTTNTRLTELREDTVQS